MSTPRLIIVTLSFAQVHALVGPTSTEPSEGHPRVREQLAAQGIDLRLPILSGTDSDRHLYWYRNWKTGDPPIHQENSRREKSR